MTDSTLVDSNVLLDIATDDPHWAAWSGEALSAALDRGLVVINPIVYAEVSVGFDRIEDLENLLPARHFVREALPWSGAFLAGKAFLAYRRRGGKRPTPLPDFYIGAHAVVAGHRLLTRDATRYATAFPGLQLITP
ncbi:type II toxin-antitoxin system VapC family toxin [Serinicoccus profundi]|uniref:type II toxin-antitoxin system VapC family toxin n=1 Tax=Serinicoccus profundi TaxID=1078471 RepID=UPI000255E842|nr:type II toxin-antitoxin system VapC family toxin [Serinicoccus profundi]